jgi:hypothetical protein
MTRLVVIIDITRNSDIVSAPEHCTTRHGTVPQYLDRQAPSPNLTRRSTPNQFLRRSPAPVSLQLWVQSIQNLIKLQRLHARRSLINSTIAHANMPRPKVLKERRLRIAKACLYCQASKQKCDGLAPCVQCTKRGKSNACVYSAHQRSYGRRPRDVGVGQGSASPSEQALLPSSDMILPESNGMNEPVGSIAVPKLPHDMFDTKGRRVRT